MKNITSGEWYSKGFAHGMAAALAEIADIRGDDVLVDDILRRTGMTSDVARYASPSDYRILKRAIPSLRRPKRGKAK